MLAEGQVERAAQHVRTGGPPSRVRRRPQPCPRRPHKHFISDAKFLEGITLMRSSLTPPLPCTAATLLNGIGSSPGCLLAFFLAPSPTRALLSSPSLRV